MIQVECGCGRKLKAGDEHAGRRAKCPVCGKVVTLPATAPLDLETGQSGTLPGMTVDDTSRLPKQVVDMIPPTPTVSEPTLPAEHGSPAESAARPTAKVGFPSAASSSESTIQAGLKVGQYIVERKLGSGAMGEVWLARDPHLARWVALKILPPAFARDEERLRRFIREARLAAQLNHPNAVTIHQIDLDGDHAYIAMEFVDGPSLDKVATLGNPLEWRDATRVVRDAATGLAAAHEIGLVHRDVKPANLMRTTKGLTKVVDFGLARAEAAETQLTQLGTVLGTPAFMAPEQWIGRDVDGRSDVYSLTCSYYYLLTGRPPFDATSAAALGYQHRYEPPADPRQFGVTLPDAVCRVLTKGLQKDPSQRYASATAMVADAERLLAMPDGAQTFRAAWTPMSASAGTGAARPMATVPSGPVSLVWTIGNSWVWQWVWTHPRSTSATLAPAALLFGALLMVVFNRSQAVTSTESTPNGAASPPPRVIAIRTTRDESADASESAESGVAPEHDASTAVPARPIVRSSPESDSTTETTVPLANDGTPGEPSPQLVETVPPALDESAIVPNEPASIPDSSPTTSEPTAPDSMRLEPPETPASPPPLADDFGAAIGRGLADNPAVNACMLHLAESERYALQVKFPEAISQLTKGLDQAPALPEGTAPRTGPESEYYAFIALTRFMLYAMRARAHVRNGDFEEGIVDCDEALRVHGLLVAAVRSDDEFVVKFPGTAYSYRGLAKAQLGQISEGLADCDKAVALLPESAEVLANRGLAWILSERADEALADLNEAIQIDPNLALAYEYRARAHALAGHVAERKADKRESDRLLNEDRQKAEAMPPIPTSP